ncbi:MAG: tRNA (adenosine(37)-N6)-dimethylallyltransferase MiaA [Candidatus Binatia bacterium]
MAAAPILAVIGPTGAGKTELSLEVASRLDAEIVNCDSRQVYRGLDIGSAKPTAAERSAVPHRLFDVVDPDEPFDAARYRDLARAAIAHIQARGRAALIVGGTGLYLKALRYGLCAGPGRDPALRARLAAQEAAEPGSLHAALAARDPASAARLHACDHARIVRALEVLELTGRPLSAWQAEHGFRTAELPMRVIGVAVDRARLYAQLDARCTGMLAAGLLDEIRALWARGYAPELPALRSIGYRELGAYLRGECDRASALSAMQRATRRLAKRQLTWFRADPTVEWLPPAAVAAAALR